MTTTIDKPSEPDTPSEASENLEITEIKISGYEGGKQTIFKEPSLYLSIIAIFFATSVCLLKTPVIFLAAFTILSALAVAFHVIAERFLFRANKEFDAFAAPFEGVFVLTLGVIIPGISLLSYGVFSLATSPPGNMLELVGKLLLLLIVPFFNFAVWSSVRKRYIAHPRVVGLMNGLALGLSGSWTLIWLASMFVTTGAPSCKLGWMLLLCASPALLFAATCLNIELWRKTETNISRITTTFSILGGLLALLFVLTPMGRSIYVQSLVSDAKNGSTEKQIESIASLRKLATDEDLRPSSSPTSGFALAEMLLPNRGFDAATELDRNLYFRVTGKPFELSRSQSDEPHYNQNVGTEISGLALAKSQLNGNISPASLSGDLNWTFVLHNSTGMDQEARAELEIPPGAVVSQATLWVDGNQREAIFASAGRASAAYEEIVNARRDPLLVKMTSDDKVLIRCFPVPGDGRDMKLRIGFKLPLSTTETKTACMQLPRILSSNFSQPKRHRFSLQSAEVLAEEIPGVACSKQSNGYVFNGILKINDNLKGMKSIKVRRPDAPLMVIVPDVTSPNKRYLVQQLRKVSAGAVRNLSIVIDMSDALKSDIEQIRHLLSSIPEKLNPIVYLVEEQPSKDFDTREIVPQPLQAALPKITKEAFIGGQDNRSYLREALEVAAERPGNAVLWIHGPQPISYAGMEKQALDLVNPVRLYDLRMSPTVAKVDSKSDSIKEPNELLNSIDNDDVSNQLSIESVAIHSGEELKAFISRLDNGTTTVLQRSVTTAQPQTLTADPAIANQITALWARDEVSKLLNKDEDAAAVALGSTYRVVTPATGAIVFENDKQQREFEVNRKKVFNSVRPQTARGGGLVGAPVDPRYGQSNEIGQIADFGYDTARDLSRFATALTFVIACIVGFLFVKGKKPLSNQRLAKAAILILVAPTIAHLFGTFIINNYGGLGGGL
ncbi:hypothetical protein KF728_07030 [Candidatus Obscuribacterales bacterium]|nr:hypothetical protein [Candidatus Obscuribacterales bacterium]